jgi:type IV pilus assembly protein PilF
LFFDSSGSERPNDPFAQLSASQVFIQKGVHYMEKGLYDIALQDLKKAVELDGSNSEAHNALGVLYEKLDDFANADSSFRKAISLKPDNFAARNNYGRFLCARGNSAAAFDQFKTVIDTKLYGQPWVPLTNSGICARSIGKLADAEQYLRDALAAQPNFAPALIEMARISRDGRQYLSARGFLQRYFDAAGANAEALLLGVEIEVALGNRQQAEDYAESLRKRFPGTKETVLARRRIAD